MRYFCIVFLVFGLVEFSSSPAHADELCGTLTSRGNNMHNSVFMRLQQESIKPLESGGEARGGSREMDKNHKPHSGYAEIVSFSPELDESIDNACRSQIPVCLSGVQVNSVSKVEWGFFDRSGFLPLRNVEVRSLFFVKGIVEQDSK